MALTRDHRETVQARARRDPEFREYLLTGGVECLLAGEVGVGKIILRDYIIATVGFEQLGEMTDQSPESLTQVLGPEDDPRASDLLDIIACILRREGLALQVKAVREERDGADRAVVESSAAR